MFTIFTAPSSIQFKIHDSTFGLLPTLYDWNPLETFCLLCNITRYTKFNSSLSYKEQATSSEFQSFMNFNFSSSKWKSKEYVEIISINVGGGFTVRDNKQNTKGSCELEFEISHLI